MDTMKFRAWDKVIKKMTYDNFVLDPKGNLSFHWQKETFNSANSITMQFTGLKDKKGKEIWEGDIVKLKYGHPNNIEKKTTITFHKGAFCIAIEGLEDKATAIVTYEDQCLENGVDMIIEVVGNIYETQNSNELLAKK